RRQLWIDMTTAACLHHRARPFDTADREIRGRELGERNDACRERYVLALASRRQPFAVPALESVIQGARDARAQAKPHRKTDCHLAPTAQRTRQHQRAARDDARDRVQALAEPAPLREAAHEPR